MIFKNLISSLSRARLWVATSLAVGLSAGLVAAFFFNPYVVTCHIKNIGGYFDILALKSAKLQVASLSGTLLAKITDPVRARALSKMIGKPEWVETNITAVYGMTKADVRELVEAQLAKNTAASYTMSFINFKDNAEDKTWARDNLNFVAIFILNIAQKDRLSAWLSATKNNYQHVLMDVAQQLPDITLLLKSNRERVEAIKNINTTNPDATKNTHLYLSMNQGQVNSNNNNSRIPINNEDLTAFLSPEIQLSGLQINQAFLIETLNQLRFKREVSEYLADRASEGQGIVDHLDLGLVTVAPDLPNEFWRHGKILDLLQKEQGWRLEYVENTVKSLELQQKELRAAYEEIAKQSKLYDHNRKFSRLIAIIAGVLAGIIAPLLVFSVIQMSETEKPMSDKA